MKIEELLMKFISKVQASERLTLAIIRATGKEREVIQALQTHLSDAERAKSHEAEALQEYIQFLSGTGTNSFQSKLSLVPPIPVDEEQ